MLFAVHMDVALPDDLGEERKAVLVSSEKTYCQELQRSGEWLSIWRCVGRYANLSIFDVADNERMHEILWGLPLFPYLSIEVTALSTHPSALPADAVDDLT